MIDVKELREWHREVLKYKTEVGVKDEQASAENDISEWNSLYWMVESLEISIDELVMELEENEDIYGT